MSREIGRLTLSVLFCTGVVSLVLEPSPTASFRRYNSGMLNCTVGENWNTVIFKTKIKDQLFNIAFFTDTGTNCKDNLPPSVIFQNSCDYSLMIFYVVIRNVTDAYAMRYMECSVVYKSNQERNGIVSTTIDVQYPPTSPPSITQIPNIYVVEGNNVVLSCEISDGNPLANISWDCDGFATVTESASPSTMNIVSRVEKVVTKEDNNKECICKGTHPLWKENKEINHILTVNYRPMVTVSPNYNEYNLVENTENFSLTCTVTGANPNVDSYKWYKDDTEISTAAKYTISPVNRSHTGNYTCDAGNIVGRSNRSSTIRLNILYGIEIKPIKKTQPTEGTKLNITCSGESYPQMTDKDVIWTTNNSEKVISKGRHLVIDNVNRNDSGTYVCSVVIQLTPTVGQPVNVTGSTTVEVDVLYLPTVKISPAKSIYEVVENTTIFDLTCTVIAANPGANSFKWYKDDSEISTVTTKMYTISPVSTTHKGSYTCDAQNRAGTSNRSSALQLNVLYGIRITPIPKSQPTEGKNFSITCSGESYPKMTDNDVTWTKQNSEKVIRKGQHLVIDNVNRNDSGMYVCSVLLQLTPTVGQSVNVTGTTTVEVDVFYKPTVRVYPEFISSFVTENTTDIRINCNLTDGNPPDSSFRWNKNGVWIASEATYIISKVKRSHSGSYTCYANNSVGMSDASPVFPLNVLYGVSLEISQTEINVNESEMWYISCIGDGNPLPKITCANKYNNSIVGEQINNVTSIHVDHANCIDTGLYICSGNNSIGETVSKLADIKVACKPRTYNNLDKQDIFINGTADRLYISTTFISYPLSVMSWSRELPNGNLIELDNEFNTTIIQSHLPYEQISLLQKDILENNEFGIYLLEASNIHGSFLLTYNVIPKRQPDPPTNITATCDITSISVTWISRFNGGENQTFRIYFVNNRSNQTLYKDDIADEGEDTQIKEEKEFLSPGTLYSIFLEAYNLYGGKISDEIATCTTKINPVENQPVASALVGGIAGSISAFLIVVVIVGVLYFWRRRHVNGVDKKLIGRHSKETDEDEEGLKTNPLYVSSGEVSNAEVGPVYGVVNKKRQEKEIMTLDENNDHGPVYSSVQKPTKQEKKKRKEKNVTKTPRNENYKDIELGAVYENSDKVSKLNSSDELYANAGEPGKGVNLAKGYIPKKNKDGLIYADLDLLPGPNGRKFVIRGIENKTNYAMIDLSIKVDPLPSDDDEEDKDSEKSKSAANECNE